MKLILSLAAIALACLATADVTVTTPTLNPPDWSPYINKAIEAQKLQLSNGQVTIPTLPPGQVLHLLTPVLENGNPFIKVDLVYKGDWNSLESDHAGPAFRFLGIKTGRVDIRGLVLTVPGSTGILVDGDAQHGSTSNDQIRCEIHMDAANCVGVQIGSTGSNDVSGITVRDSVIETPWTALADVSKNGCVGILTESGNTLKIAAHDTTISGCNFAVETGNNGQPTGGAGLQLDNVGGSDDAIFVGVDGAFPIHWHDFRVENGDAAVLSGFPHTAGSGTGAVTIDNGIIEGYQCQGIAGTDPGVLFQFNGHQQVLIDAISGDVTTNHFTTANWIGIRSYGTAIGPSIAVSRTFASLSTVKAIEGFFGVTTATN